MGLFDKYNRVPTLKEGVDLNAMEFRKLRDFAGQTVYVDGFFFSHTRFGESVAVVGNGYKINMPSRAVKEFHEMLEDKAVMDAIMNGHLCITNITIRPSQNQSGVTVNYSYKEC